MKHFLIVKTSALGDIIHAFPVVAYLKDKFPNAHIDWVVEKPFAQLLQSHPSIERTLIVDTKNWRKGKNFSELKRFRHHLHAKSYDAVFDLQGNIKSGLIVFQANSKHKIGFSRESVSEWPNLLFTNHKYSVPKGKNIREDYLAIVQAYFEDPLPFKISERILLNVEESQKQSLQALLSHPNLLGRNTVMVCPGSAWVNKQLSYPALENLTFKIKGQKNCSFVFIWGTKEEQAIAQRLQNLHPTCSVVADKMPLPMLQFLMAQMDLIVSMDSLPLHLAATTGKPTLSFFGASLAEKYKPLGAIHQAFQGACPYGEVFEKRCPKLRTCKSGHCIRSLTGTEI